MKRIALAATLLLLAFSLPAAAQELYGSEYGGYALYLIDTSSGSHTVVGDPPGDTLPGLAFDPISEIMYATDEYNLYTVDLNTAATNLVGGHGAQVTGLTFSGDYSTLYSIGYNGTLYAINPATGAASAVGPLGVAPNTIVDLATNSSGVVYAAGTAGNLYTVNTATGAATSLGAITGLPGSGGVTAMAFSDADVLYAIDTTTDGLVTINTTTLAATSIGGSIGSDVRGLAFGVARSAALPADVPLLPSSGLAALAILVAAAALVVLRLRA